MQHPSATHFTFDGANPRPLSFSELTTPPPTTATECPSAPQKMQRKARRPSDTMIGVDFKAKWKAVRAALDAEEGSIEDNVITPATTTTTTATAHTRPTAASSSAIPSTFAPTPHKIVRTPANDVPASSIELSPQLRCKGLGSCRQRSTTELGSIKDAWKHARKSLELEEEQEAALVHLHERDMSLLHGTSFIDLNQDHATHSHYGFEHVPAVRRALSTEVSG